MRPCEHRGKQSEWEWMGTMRIMRMDDGEIQKAAEPWVLPLDIECWVDLEITRGKKLRLPHGP